jgi:hypothetical protein
MYINAGWQGWGPNYAAAHIAYSAQNNMISFLDYYLNGSNDWVHLSNSTYMYGTYWPDYKTFIQQVDVYAPKVVLGMDLSPWALNYDPTCSGANYNDCSRTPEQPADEVVAFINDLRTNFLDSCL